MSTKNKMGAFSEKKDEAASFLGLGDFLARQMDREIKEGVFLGRRGEGIDRRGSPPFPLGYPYAAGWLDTTASFCLLGDNEHKKDHRVYLSENPEEISDVLFCRDGYLVPVAYLDKELASSASTKRLQGAVEWGGYLDAISKIVNDVAGRPWRLKVTAIPEHSMVFVQILEGEKA